MPEIKEKRWVVLYLSDATKDLWYIWGGFHHARKCAIREFNEDAHTCNRLTYAQERRIGTLKAVHVTVTTTWDNPGGAK